MFAIIRKPKQLPAAEAAPTESTGPVADDGLDNAKKEIATLVAAGTIFEGGTIRLTNGAKINGHICASVLAGEHPLIVSKGAVISGEIIEAGKLFVYGTVRGYIRAGMVVVMEGGMVEGEVHYQSLRVAPGADVSGKLVRYTEKNVPVTRDASPLPSPSSPTPAVSPVVSMDNVTPLQKPDPQAATG